MVLNTEWAQVEVIDLINDGSGLAFGIIGGRSTGVVVKTILPGGVADRDGRLQSGDHILQIGEVNLRGLGSEQVASVLRQCGVHVRLVVARPVESTSGDYQVLGSRAPIVPTKILGDPVELDRHLIENGYAEAFAAPPPSTTNYETPFIYTGRPSELQLHPISGIVDVVRDPLPIGTVQPPRPAIVPQNLPKLLPLDMALREPALPETEVYNIQLKKDDLGLGITVAGYVCEKEEISGIFVKSISKGSAADLTRKIKVNDRIIEVDGKSVIGCTNHEAVKILRNTDTVVTLTLERYLRGPKYEQLQQAIRANELRSSSPPSPSVSSLPKVPLSLVQMESLTIEPDLDSRTSIDFDSTVFQEAPTPPAEEEEKEIVIDNKKTVKFNLFDSDSLRKKWKVRLSEEAEIIVAEITKEPTLGLGISLEGTVDVEDGVEVRPRHYIRNILPDGPVGRRKLLQAGDELLEVNGIQLMGLNHLDVVTTLKQLPNVVNLTCARYPVPTRVINTAQHREAFEERNILGGSLHNFIPPTDLVKAKSDTSLASSVASELCGSGACSRSRSLEAITGLPMWSDTITIVELIKGDRGLGFSVLDYQDPLDQEKTVIVIRSLVPGGVAQTDGRLIPGDKLVAVNDVLVEHATLDEAVRVLKGAPKGVVKLAVAKPLNAHESTSYTSQDTEEDQTCLDEFQECIEEYQECLEVVQICMYEDSSFNHSDNAEIIAETDTKTNIVLLDNQNNKVNCQTFLKIRNDSSTQSDKVPSSEKDGYETCVDESLSEDTGANQKHIEDNNVKTETIVQTLPDIVFKEFSVRRNNNDFEFAASEPCLALSSSENHIFLDSKQEVVGLKAYDHHDDGADEFFLIQYPPEQMTMKCRSEPAVLDQCFVQKSYIRRLEEYYNDYEHCLENYKVCGGIVGEVNDDDVFRDLVVPVRSSSAPDVLDSSFVTLTYDPGPCRARRKSVFIGGFEQQDGDVLSMGLIAPIEDSSVVNGTKSNNNHFENTNSMLNKHWGSTHSVQVYREANKSLGISIVGGKVDLYSSSSKAPSKAVLGIFVKGVVEDSPAGRTGQFKTGDRILEVSGRDLTNLCHEEAVEIIRSAPNPVTFVIQSLVPWTDETVCSPEVDVKNQEQLTDSSVSLVRKPDVETREVRFLPEKGDAEVVSNHVAEPTSSEEVLCKAEEEENEGPKEVTFEDNKVELEEESSEESEEEEDVRELEGRTVSAKGMEIDRASAANLRRSQEDIDADPDEEDDFGYTMNKVKKKYANLGHSVLMVQLERGCQGLGLSLAGHKDRNCMAVFVCGLNPKGAAYRTGGIQVGDEILEVNGVVLHGRCHLNASAIIKGLSGPVFKVIILRRKTAIDDIAVKPITQFPISLAEEAPEEQFSNYPNVHTVTVKKGTQSLGIMIIEGKHAEVGQGIFVSDIQEGSAADKAGLEIGEMILAVNKDSLLGSNYDTAANLLKRTEGLVTLVVSNPGKRASTPTPTTEAEKNSVNKPALKPSAPPSRPATPTPEPVADPATCPIVPGKETTVEILTDNKGLGLFFVGGKDTLIGPAIVILEVYPGGTADKDGRLKPGDQIVEVNGVSMKDVTNCFASQSLRQTLPKMKLIVYRPEQVSYTTIEVELIKKSGKGLGISVIARKEGKGVYISEIIGGGVADIDGRIMKGDILISVNGQNVENCTGEEAGAILKTVTGKVSLTLHRYKPTVR